MRALHPRAIPMHTDREGPHVHTRRSRFTTWDNIPWAGGKFHITQSRYDRVQRGARAVNHTEMKSSVRETSSDCATITDFSPRRNV